MNYWKHLFSSAILSRGFSYFRLGNVRDLHEIPGGYSASVAGSARDDYRVEIRLKDGTPSGFSCTCPFSEDGNRCKHMAAVLYAVEAGEKEKGTAAAAAPKKTVTARRDLRTELPENAPKAPAEIKVHPFRNSADTVAEGYRYFDFSAIGEDLQINEETLAHAKRILENRSLSIRNVRTAYPLSDMNAPMMAVVNATSREGRYGDDLQLILESDRLRNYRCDVCGCYSYYAYEKNRKICAHLLAALMLLRDRFLEDDPGDATDCAGDLLLHSFRPEVPEEVTEAFGKEITLRPRLEKKNGLLNLSFRAGNDKFYIIKNLTAFCDAVAGSETFEFGKSLTADFSRDRIASDSLPLFGFLKRCTAEEQIRNEQLRERYSGIRVKDIGAALPLFSHRLDDLYSLIPETGIEWEDKSGGRGRMLPAEGAPRPAITIRKQQKNGDFSGLKITGVLPDRFEGAENDYYPCDGFLYRAPKRRALEALYSLKKGDTALSFTIGRLNLAEFWQKLLPALRECADITTEDPEEILPFIPAEPGFTFYLDLLGGRVLCRAEVSYRERTFSALDILRTSMPEKLLRVPGREREAAEMLLRWFPDRDLTNDILSMEQTDDSMYRLLNEGLPSLRVLGEICATDRFRTQRIRRDLKVSVGVSVKSGILDLTVRSSDVSVSELAELLMSYREKRAYHRLRDGSFVNLSETAGELAALLDRLKISPESITKEDLQVPAARALYLDRLLEKNERLYADRDASFRHLIRSFKTVNESDFNLPATLTATLRNYQVYGYRWLRTLSSFGFGGILADDMGLGKTLQVIAWLTSMQSPSRTSLIVTPASLVYNWMEEFRKFAPGLRAAAAAGSQAEREALIGAYREYDVLVTSYDLLKRDIGLYEGKDFLCEVIDEAQYIKNHTTAAARSVKVISASTRFALTGTPIENRLSELWSIFDYLMPGFLYDYETFREELELPIAKHEDESATERLRDMIAPFVLRRLKTSVLKELPEKLEETLYARFGKDQQKLYDAQLLRMKNLLDDTSDEDFGKNRFRLLAELTKIRQICCDPGLLFENYAGSSAKREACLDLVESAIEGGHRILLFSQFTSMLQILEDDLKLRGIRCYKLTGSTTKKARMELIRAFNEDDTPVFLISLKAGGTGINLTAADIVIHYDPWWNAAAENQATDRAHRIGQEKVVSVYKLIGKDSIEERIQELQETKKALADAVLSGEGADLTAMTREDLLRLLS